MNKSSYNPPLDQYDSLMNISQNEHSTETQLYLNTAHKPKASSKGRNRPRVERIGQTPALIFVYQEVW